MKINITNTDVYNLSSNVDCIEYTTEEEWHKLRQKGIGGSDAGAIMGLNKYTSPLKVYKIKKGIWKEDTEDNVHLKKGKDLESVIFDKYVCKDEDLKGFNIIHPEHTFINKEFPWLRANLDGLAVHKQDSSYSVLPTHKHIVIEIKWVSEWAEVNWNGDDYKGIPASYYAQVQHYMIVTGARVAYLYAMFDRTWEVKKYVIPFDASFASRLVAQTNRFYNNMLLDIAPPITASLDKEFIPEALEHMPEIVKSQELSDILAEYLSRKEEMKILEKQIDELYNKAMEKYLKGERPVGMFSMNITMCKKSGFDTKRFAAEHPEVYENYKTVTEYPRTLIKKK